MWHTFFQVSQSPGKAHFFPPFFQKFLPTVNEVQADDCLQMAIQSLVTDVSGCVSRTLGLQNGVSHITVVPEKKVNKKCKQTADNFKN